MRTADIMRTSRDMPLAATTTGHDLHLIRRLHAHRGIAVASGVLALLLLSALPAHGAYVSTGVGAPLLRPADSDNDSSWFETPAAARAATITWRSGPNLADLTSFTHNPVTESKFTSVGPNGVTGRAFTGFSYPDGPGWPCGSFANTAGGGSSVVDGGAERQFRASWSLTASGTLGAPVSWCLPLYSSRARAKDPWPLTRDDLPDPDAPYYDLYIPVDLLGGASTVGESITGDFSLSVDYETAAGMVNLLTIAVSGPTVYVSTGRDASVSYFLLASEVSGPTTDPAHLLTLADIQQMLSDDVAPDSRVDTALNLGILCNDFQTPRGDLPDGVIAQVHVDTSVFEAATIPEPASLGVLVLGGLATFGYRPRRANWS